MRKKIPAGPSLAAWWTGWRFLAVGALFVVTLLLTVVTDEVVLEGENAIDGKLFALLRPLQTEALTRLMIKITAFGSPWALLPAYVMLVGFVWLFGHNRILARNVSIAGCASMVILFTMKSVFHRQRPAGALVPDVPGASYPSGHTFSVFTFSALLVYVLWQQRAAPAVRWSASIVLALFSLLVAFSRVYLRVHYPSDVLAGLLLAVAWLTSSFLILRRTDANAARP